jgi:hypothetical protein
MTSDPNWVAQNFRDLTSKPRFSRSFPRWKFDIFKIFNRTCVFFFLT